jgi:hypothetical protein
MGKLDRRSLIAATVGLLGAQVVDPKAKKTKATRAKPVPVSEAGKRQPQPTGGVPPQPKTAPRIGKVEAGVRAERPDSASWKGVLAQNRTAYGDPDLSAALPVAARDAESRRESAVHRDDPRIWHVETQINAAADLLDRCILERSQWNDLAAKALDVRLAVEEYAGLDQIHQEETAAGFYELAANESRSEAEAEHYHEQANSLGALNLENLMNAYFSPEEIGRQSGFHQLAAWASHFATYAEDHKANLTQVTWNNVPDSIPSHLYNAAIGTSYHLLWAQRASVNADLSSRRMAARSAGARALAKRRRAEWDRMDAAFRRRRTDVIRSIADRRAKEFVTPGGALNFSEQLLPIQKRFERDYAEVLARLDVADRGLRLIYGSDVLAESNFPADRGTGLDSTVLAVREAISWLNRFKELDQDWVLPFSVRECLTPAEWQNFIDTGTCNPEVLESTFIPGHAHVRLRGVAVSVVYRTLARTESGVWQTSVRVPESSHCTHASGQRQDLDQRRIPPCRTSRVASRDSLRDPDIVGGAALHNTSPFGRWTVTMGNHSSAQVTRRQLADVFIDLHVVSQSTF